MGNSRQSMFLISVCACNDVCMQCQSMGTGLHFSRTCDGNLSVTTGLTGSEG